jgi:hypothetical protein
MGVERFEELARQLSTRDRELSGGLARARTAAETLRAHAQTCVDVFRAAVCKQGAKHLGHIDVGPVEPDAKHVDCFQFIVARGRFEAACVAKAQGKITLVGPYKRGKTEKPCVDQPLSGPEVEAGVEQLLLELIRQASERR